MININHKQLDPEAVVMCNERLMHVVQDGDVRDMY